MTKKLLLIKLLAIVVLFGLSFSGSRASALAVDEPCTDFKDNQLIGIPAWYKYLPGKGVQQIEKDGSDGEVVCMPEITAPDGELPKEAFLLIGAAILDILIRIAGLAAFIYLIYGGFMYLTSSGNSESVKKAGSTLLNAAIGLAIAISAATIVNFFASRMTGI